METPSSMRMVTRSQASIPSQKTKKEDSIPTSRTKALVDITNDSPIVGVANSILSEKTPSSSAIKNRVRVKNTPGSGEALLRGQVKTLLQKVEEEAEFVNKIPSGDRPPFRVMLNLPGPSPVQLLAPTPMNTSQVPILSELQDGVLVDTAVMASVVEQDSVKNAPIQIAEAVRQEQPLNLSECLINRALLFDSPDKSEASSVSSAVTYQGSEIEHKSPEDDSSSAWSIQVNLSVQDDEEEEEEEDVEDFDEEDEECNEEDESFDELCKGLSKMTVEEDEKVGQPEFTGKLTRFVYNSDDEIEGEVVVKEKVSPSVLVLKGLPVPEGKHLRFHDDEDEEWINE